MASAAATEESDSNNNHQGKYSLRPRAARGAETDEETWIPRSRKRKQSIKSQPLSKYRRKTANARERSRMREINEAFEALRRVIPQVTSPNETQNEKLTKITTLRLAMKYISALNLALQEPDLESDGESLLSDYTLTPCDFHSFTSPSQPSAMSLYDPSPTPTIHDHPLTPTGFSLEGVSDAVLATHTITASVFADSLLPVLGPLDTDPSLGNSSYTYDDAQFIDFS